MNSSINEIQKALDILYLPSMISNNDIKKQYHFLTKKNHPDIGGDEKVMEELNYAYRLLMKYIEEFRYSFSEDEISKQFPGANYAEQFKP